MTAELERLPTVGDVVVVDGWQLEITAVDGFRVDRVRVTPLRRGSE